MKCPHCCVEVHPSFHEQFVESRPNTVSSVGGLLWRLASMECPACKRAIFYLTGTNQNGGVISGPMLVYPRSASRPAAPAEVPDHIASDYREACLVAEDSPKASAALSRRCLQALLRDKGFEQKDLARAIDAAIDAHLIPSGVAENLDAVRNIGNFAAHPQKDKNSGEILPVEPHEADWNLDVLEQLFDALYVQPARAKERRQALDNKLAAAGKPPLKG